MADDAQAHLTQFAVDAVRLVFGVGVFRDWTIGADVTDAIRAVIVGLRELGHKN